MDLVLPVHTLSTVMLAGLIWFVQLVHYPLFARVGADAFAHYAREHARRVTWLVAPLMGLETFTAAILVFTLNAPGPRRLAVCGAALVAVNWCSTAFLQVPCHRALSAGFNWTATRRLVKTNWLRTAAWTARAGIAIVLSLMLADSGEPGV